jgi:hypothetical protein
MPWQHMQQMYINHTRYAYSCNHSCVMHGIFCSVTVLPPLLLKASKDKQPPFMLRSDRTGT